MTIKELVEPKLAKPGAGLPFLEWAVAKYVLLPQRFRSVSPEEAQREFVSESEMILAAAKRLDKTQLLERRLIPRLPGLEDSSRYWSVAMTLDHLVIVGSGIRYLIVGLTSGKKDLPTRTIAQVKPSADVSAETIAAEFEKMTQAFVDTLHKCDLDAFPDATHPHPWFGPFTATQWVVMAASHQQIHRKQVEQIIKRL
jgi:uncharacterized damage-inducible protein DinB